jgi:hypothetical protein
MKPEYPLPVRYVLYTHYSEGNDWKDYDSRNISPHKLDGVQYLVKHLSNLSGLLTWPGYEGLLVLFYGRSNKLLAYSKIDGVVMQKSGRKLQDDLRKYIFDAYLPTLLRGAILDAWITPEPLLKYRLEELAQKTDRDKLSKMLNRRQPGGLLPTALQRALETCKFIPDATFKARLKESALKRMREVRKQWGELRDKGVETFASAWAKGRAQEYCPDFLLNYPGIVLDPKVPIDADLTHVPLLPLIMENLNDLIKDATNYIHWTRDWPTIVQVVRSFEQGTLRTDLNYDA